MPDSNEPDPSSTNPNTPSPEVIREFPDRGAQWLLADPIHLRHLLQLLQPELAQRLDVNRAERINRTMIPADLQKKESDLIFRVPYRATGKETGGPKLEWEVWIYVLLEHQSQHGPLIFLRLLLYMAELWSEQLRSAEANRIPDGKVRISPVIPIVFYTGEAGWTTPLDLAHLMELPPELGRFVPRWDTLFLNLHQTAPQALTQFSTAIGYALGVWQAENRPFTELQTVVEEALTGLEGLSEEQAGEWQRMAWFLLLLVFHRRERAEYDVLAAQIRARTRASKFAARGEAEQMAQTMAEYVKEEGIRIGQARGIEIGQTRGIEIGQTRGIEIGQVRAARQALSTVLIARFGELPSVNAQVIEAADIQQIEGWLRVAATATSLEAVGIETQQ